MPQFYTARLPQTLGLASTPGQRPLQLTNPFHRIGARGWNLHTAVSDFFHTMEESRRHQQCNPNPGTVHAIAGFASSDFTSGTTRVLDLSLRSPGFKTTRSSNRSGTTLVGYGRPARVGLICSASQMRSLRSEGRAGRGAVSTAYASRNLIAQLMASPSATCRSALLKKVASSIRPACRIASPNSDLKS